MNSYKSIMWGGVLTTIGFGCWVISFLYLDFQGIGLSSILSISIVMIGIMLSIYGAHIMGDE